MAFLVERKESVYSFLMSSQISRDLLRLKLEESVGAPVPDRTPRDVRVPRIAGKAKAVVGVRRGGKTSFLQRRMTERLAEGRPRQSQLLISLEDERLLDMTAADLGWIIEEHERRNPGLRANGELSLYLDEVQTVPGWEKLVRRLIDGGAADMFVAGSSAKLLSREVATSLRGRAMEVRIYPFSFREALRHRGEEPAEPWERLDGAERASIEAALRRYLAEGGFPEAQGSDPRDRLVLLRGYVDVMVLRDVIERHDVSNVPALRWLQRHLLATPAGHFSMKKLYDSLRSQGIPVGKDTLYAYLDHLCDAFLIRTISMHSRSERQRMANPRKAYPIDPGLIPLYERTGRERRGRALETAVLLELERRGYTVEWVRTESGWEVDFLAQQPGARSLLLQVSLDTSADETWEREVRASAEGAAAHPEAEACILTLDPTPPRHDLPAGTTWRPVSRWLLESAAETAAYAP